MSIIQTIRDKAAVLVFGIIAISLIGFLVQDAFVGRTHNFFDSPSANVGSIGGQSISREEFDNRVKNAEAQYQSQGYRVDEAMRQEIQTQIWNGLVSRQLVEAEAKKLGLSFTSKEFSSLLFSENAPQEFKQQFTDPKTGIYNIEAARNAFKQIQKTKDANQLKQINEQLIDPIILSQLQNKLMTIFTNGVYLPKWLMEKQNAENNQVSSINFVGLSYSTVPDTTIKISDAAITEYIQSHKDEFKQEASRSISYVLFNAAANKADSTNLWNKMEQLKPQFEQAADAGVFVTRNGSKSTFFDGFINKSRIQVPQKDSILALPAGQVYGPYYDGSAITLARVVASKVLPDSVRARHILISTVDPQTRQPSMPDSIAKKRVDSIQQAIAGGASFETLAVQYSDDEGSKEKLGDLGFFANGQMVKEFNDFCFDGKVGSKGVVKTQFGYHYIEVLEQKNFEMAYKIAYMAKNIEPSKETDDAANAAATQFASASRDQKSFDETVIKQNLNKRIADAVKEMDYQIPGIGNSRSFIKWIFSNKPGTVSEPTTVGDQYVVAVITGERAKGLQSATAARLMVEPILRNKEKAKQIAQKFGKYASVDEAAKNVGQQPQLADSIRFSDNFKPGFGNEPVVIGAAFNKENQSKPSQPLAGNTGVYVVAVAGNTAAPAATVDLDQQRKAALMQMKQMVGYGLMQALKESAEVKDERLKAGY